MNDNSGDRRGARGRPRPRRAGLLVLAAGIALLAAGCGANTAGSSDVLSPSAQAMNAYARCIESHGLSVYAVRYVHHGSTPPPADVPLFGNWTIVGDGLSSPAYPAASKACQHLLPTGTAPSESHQQLVRALKGAACMRAHGYPGFPDPTDQPGYLSYPPLPASIDTSSPRFESMVKACGVFPFP
jgi:hypothetical protein